MEEEYEAISEKLDRLSAKQGEWGAMKPSARLKVLKKLKSNLGKVDQVKWFQDSMELQGLDIKTPEAKNAASLEQFVGISTMAGHLDALIATYLEMSKNGDSFERPRPKKLKFNERVLKDGRIVVQPPRSMQDRALGQSIEVYLQKGSNQDGLEVNDFAGELCLSLGAGNQIFLTFCDVIHQLFNSGAVVMLKHHPLRTFSYEPFSVIFKEMIDEGFFAQTVCSLENTSKLTLDSRVTTLHMTGGKPAHDAIVKNLEENGKKIKHFSSELGNVTPHIIVSGGQQWTTEDIKATINGLLLGVVAQQSCNCLSPKVIVIDKDMPQHDEIIAHLTETLGNVPLPPAYYPGTKARYQKFQDAFSEKGTEPTVVSVEAVESRPAKGIDPQIFESEKAPLPHLIIKHEIDMDNLDNRDIYDFRNEAFAPVLSIASIHANNDTLKFCELATEFCHELLFGSLSATVTVHPSLEGSEAVGDFVDNLKYGCVAVNGWTAFAYAQMSGTWGAYPGEDIHNVESGIGVVHNCLMLQNVEKTVLRLPFKNALQQDMTDDSKVANPLVVSSGVTFATNPSFSTFGGLMKSLFKSMIGKTT